MPKRCDLHSFPTRRSSDLHPATSVAALQRDYLGRGLDDLSVTIVHYGDTPRSEEHTSELQSQSNLVCRLPLEKKKCEPRGRALLHARLFCSDATSCSAR